MGILARTGRTGCPLLPLVTCVGIRVSGMIRLTRGRLLGLLLALLVLTLPAVGITRLPLPAIPLTIPAVGLMLLVLPLLVLTLPPRVLTIPAVGLTLLVLPLIPLALPLWPVSFPSPGLPPLMSPLPVLPLRRLTTVAVSISSGWLPPGPLTIPAVGLTLLVLPLLVLTLLVLPLLVLTLPAIGSTPGRLKLSPLPLEHIGIAPWRLRGEGPSTRLLRGRAIRPGQGVWRA
jgi:hypothetical protein